MAQYQFLDFRFDTDTFHLYRDKVRCDIRPKTAQLLVYLITNRDRTISKKELFQAGWQSEHVQDHTLFQVISEIRKLAPKVELIHTQPNLGYRWVVATILAKRCQWLSKASIAASVAVFSLTAVAVSVSFNWQSGLQPKTAQTDVMLTNDSQTNLMQTAEQQNDIAQSSEEKSVVAITLPAISAYSKAVVALERGEYEEAEGLLRFSLSENPESHETQLLLAETLYLQNKFEASENYARLILDESNPSAYITSATSDLLSRVYQKQGSYFDALTYAINGADMIEPTQAQCTFKVLDQRIDTLKEIIEQQAIQPNSSSLVAESDRLKPQALPANSTLSTQSTSQPKAQTEREGKASDDCEKFQSTDKKENTSACVYSGEADRIAFSQIVFDKRRNA